jgi:hypothetical protein
MTADEKRLYRTELRLIKRHFSGLKPRPIKIDNELPSYGRADDDALSVNLKLHKFKREIEETLIHELIHYELKDANREYWGHGRAFLKRAKQLGILGRIELWQCVSMEEDRMIPNRVEHFRKPLAEFAAEVEKQLEDLRELTVKIPNPDLRLILHDDAFH